MRQFQIPQFITVEDRVVGPFTVKQALILGGAVVLIVVFSRFFAPSLAVLLSIPLAILALALAFLRINEQSFTFIFKNMVSYFLKPRIYIWRREDLRTPETAKETQGKSDALIVKTIPKISSSKLSDLAWSLDIKQRQMDQMNNK